MRSIGILVALPDEGRTLIRRRLSFESLTPLPGGHWLAVAGAGPEAAERHAQSLVAQGIEGLVSWGCAAALQDTLLPGTLLLPERIRCVDGLEHAVDHDWHAAVKGILEAQHAPRTETLIESTVVVASAKDKRSLHETSGAYAVDMESAAVARVAASNALPFLVIRSVADPARLDFPPALLKALNPRGDVRMGALLAGLLQRPRAIPELMTLGRHFGSAMKTLDSARSLLGDDFQYPKNRSTPS